MVHCYHAFQTKFPQTHIHAYSPSNSVEMRHSVATPSYLFFRALDNLFASITSPKTAITTTSTNTSTNHSNTSILTLLSRTPFPTASPSGWLPLYTMVTFRPDVSYSTAQAKVERQQAILASIGRAGAVLGVVGVGLSVFRLVERLRGV
jgi:kynurenine 3-monooxygenase